MKKPSPLPSLLAAGAIILLTVTLVILSSSLCLARIDDALDRLPREDAPPEEGKRILSELDREFEGSRLLFYATLPHEEVDELEVALSGAVAAAESADPPHFAVCLSELRDLLEELKKEMSLSLLNLV